MHLILFFFAYIIIAVVGIRCALGRPLQNKKDPGCSGPLADACHNALSRRWPAAHPLSFSNTIQSFFSAFFAHLCRCGPSARHPPRQSDPAKRTNWGRGHCRQARGPPSRQSPTQTLFGQEERPRAKRGKNPPRTHKGRCLVVGFISFFFSVSCRLLHFRVNKKPPFFGSWWSSNGMRAHRLQKIPLGGSTAALR